MINAAKSPGFFSEMGKAFTSGWKAADNPPNATPKAKLEPKLAFGFFTLQGKSLTHQAVTYPVKGARATVESAASAKTRMTATRVVGGAIVLGPLGALLGGMAKKDQSKIFLIVEMADGTVITDRAQARHEAVARRFAGAINTAASR
ncbi:hypothetical protein [Rhodococcus sp. ARC_M6]|uniref:hypothetical protein n=1 Tax=Rhodococcus sp. ARC_M6 TaxID=2928852 RepID=UPI001FB32984|nr:hypothetical protein [Rhodococcus sp. ARC_M6]MCJ0906225.1 hypothetical protein [Rhodococcus sp. ARC_M6]